MKDLAGELAAAEKKPRNQINEALKSLSDRDRQAWTDAVIDGSPSQVKLARLLTKYSGIEVGHKQVSDWKRRNHAD